MESEQIALTNEEFAADVDQKIDALDTFIRDEFTTANGINLRTTLYALAQLSGYFFSIYPVEARALMIAEFSRAWAMALAANVEDVMTMKAPEEKEIN